MLLIRSEQNSNFSRKKEKSVAGASSRWVFVSV